MLSTSREISTPTRLSATQTAMMKTALLNRKSWSPVTAWICMNVTPANSRADGCHLRRLPCRPNRK